MASIIGKGVGKIASKVGEIQSAGIFTSPLNKLWRAKILLNRELSPMQKDGERKKAKEYDAKNKHYAKEGSLSKAQSEDSWTFMKKNVYLKGGSDPSDRVGIDYTAFNVSQNSFPKINNQITIVNRHTSPPTVLTIQNRPNELRVEPKANWVAVSSMGRNNPFMMYTGGEDTISFDISWFATDSKNRDEVITKCRLLESFSRANGYASAPPTLQIIWGTSGLFDNDLFILESAAYTLTHFQNASRGPGFQHTDMGEREIMSNYIEPIDLKLYPNCATQTLVFKRVSAYNRTHVDIIPMEALQRTKGISV